MNATLYEKDYYLWLEEMSQLLQDGNLAELDIRRNSSNGQKQGNLPSPTCPSRLGDCYT